MENPKQKFRQSFIVFEKPGILSEKLKTLPSSNQYRVEYFLLRFCTHFLHINVYKGGVEIFFSFCLNLQLFTKINKELVSTHSWKPGFILFYQDSNKMERVTLWVKTLHSEPEGSQFNLHIDLWVEISIKNAVINTGQQGCPIDCDPKLAVGQPNSR